MIRSRHVEKPEHCKDDKNKKMKVYKNVDR